jgi:hypothetical protein
MKNLQRFTTQFKGIEDRILFIGEDADGETVSLWLTQRLLLKTIPVLLDWLQKNDPVDLKAADNRARASEMAQVFASEPVQPNRQAGGSGKNTALSEKPAQPGKPQQPVEPGAEARLVHAIHLALNPKQVQLRFQQHDEELATLSLEGAPLRQWLVVLHVLWKKSDWPADIWPDWLRENSKIAATRTERAYH